MERIIMHIDVNSAFLSWSAVKLLKEGSKIDLRNEISVVSGREASRHGIVVAASIPAKKIGIRSPMNLRDAKRIYKDVIVTLQDRDFYKECSNNMMRLIKYLFPTYEQFSIDECFVDYTEMRKLYGNEVKFAHKLKDEIYKRFGFTVNVGIGNNKLLAKMASDFEKPNKVHTLYLNEIKEKMWPLDVSNLFMAGKSASKKLKDIGINTIGDLANFDQNKIIGLLKSHGKMLYEYANGIDDSPVQNNYDDRKGIGFSKTLEDDIEEKSILYSNLNDFSKKISNELKKRKLYAGVIVVTIRYASFKTYNHQIKLKNNTNSSEELYEYAKTAFNKLWNSEPVRLIGLRVSDLTTNNDIQLSLFDENNKVIKDKEINNLIEEINKEFGSGTVVKGFSNLKKEKL
ncbi:MAG: DNA polymerase IV [Bacilli bacterium]|nr:DNA polymerase IV [Bacilli bacterium]